MTTYLHAADVQQVRLVANENDRFDGIGAVDLPDERQPVAGDLRQAVTSSTADTN